MRTQQKNIKDFREEKGLSRRQLSELTGIPVRTIQSWELGDRTAPEYMLGLIEKATERVSATSRGPVITASVPVDTAALNRVLLKDPQSLTKEDKVFISKMYVQQMLTEFERKDRGGIYGFTQRHMAYNSSKMEGNQLTKDDTVTLFETEQLPPGEYRTKDIEEMTGHFLMFNYALPRIYAPLTEEYIKSLHRELQSGVFEFRANGYTPGGYKTRINKVGTIVTSHPDDVSKDMSDLLNSQLLENDSTEAVALFHSRFEQIHPFQDGNGRTGRMVMFKESLAHGQLPIIIEDAHKATYREALRLSQTEGSNQQLFDFINMSQEFFYGVLQEYMYDHSISLGEEDEEKDVE